MALPTSCFLFGILRFSSVGLLFSLLNRFYGNSGFVLDDFELGFFGFWLNF